MVTPRMFSNNKDDSRYAKILKSKKFEPKTASRRNAGMILRKSEIVKKPNKLALLKIQSADRFLNRRKSMMSNKGNNLGNSKRLKIISS